MDTIEINGKQLLLLCALRREPVNATNVETYSWTIRHDSTLNKLMAEENDIPPEKYTDIYEDRKSVIQKQFPVMESKNRSFIIHQNDMGCSLSDMYEDMSWYSPRLSAEDWRYNGIFLLNESLTKREKFFLFEFL